MPFRFIIPQLNKTKRWVLFEMELGQKLPPGLRRRKDAIGFVCAGRATGT
jgi:hypothetical protein